MEVFDIDYMNCTECEHSLNLEETIKTNDPWYCAKDKLVLVNIEKKGYTCPKLNDRDEDLEYSYFIYSMEQDEDDCWMIGIENGFEIFIYCTHIDIFGNNSKLKRMEYEEKKKEEQITFAI